ncbi:Translation initiation factor eIF-2B subunit epsilon, partial [Entophlyctis sp. JEL0112]
RSILADGVVLLDGVVVERGSVLSFNVQVGPKFRVKEFARLTARKPRRSTADSSESEDDSDEGEEDKNFDVAVVGRDGKGYAWIDHLSDDDDDNDEGNQPKQLRLLDVCALARETDFHQMVNDIGDEDDSDDEDEDDLSPEEVLARSRRELASTIERAFDENHTIDNLVLELNTLKFAENLDFHDIRAVAVPTILSRVSDTKSLAAIVKRWGGVLQKFSKHVDDQIDLLNVLVEHCHHNEPHTKMFAQILLQFFEADICAEAGFVKWQAQMEKGKYKDIASRFVTWLQEAEEESDEEESESD